MSESGACTLAQQETRWGGGPSTCCPYAVPWQICIESLGSVSLLCWWRHQSETLQAGKIWQSPAAAHIHLWLDEPLECQARCQVPDPCCRSDKLLAVMALLRLGSVRRKVLVFVNSIDSGYRLRLFLEAFGIRSAVLNSELPLNSRHHILQARLGVLGTLLTWGVQEFRGPLNGRHHTLQAKPCHPAAWWLLLWGASKMPKWQLPSPNRHFVTHLRACPTCLLLGLLLLGVCFSVEGPGPVGCMLGPASHNRGSPACLRSFSLGVEADCWPY